MRRSGALGDAGHAAMGPISGTRRWLRWGMRVALLLVVIAAALLMRWYDFRVLTEDSAAALGARGRPGDRFVFRSVGENTAVGTGTVVQVRCEVPDGLAERLGTRSGLLLTEIRGTPGMELHLKSVANGFAIYLDGADTGYRVSPGDLTVPAADRRLRDGAIPDGHYLLLNPDPDAPRPDSRHLGFVPRSALLKKGMRFL